MLSVYVNKLASHWFLGRCFDHLICLLVDVGWMPSSAIQDFSISQPFTCRHPELSAWNQKTTEDGQNTHLGDAASLAVLPIWDLTHQTWRCLVDMYLHTCFGQGQYLLLCCWGAKNSASYWPSFMSFRSAFIDGTLKPERPGGSKWKMSAHLTRSIGR